MTSKSCICGYMFNTSTPNAGAICKHEKSERHQSFINKPSINPIMRMFQYQNSRTVSSGPGHNSGFLNNGIYKNIT